MQNAVFRVGAVCHPPDAEQKKGSPLKVLAIDDDRDVLKVLGSILSRRLPEARLLTACDGGTGLDLAKAEDPDVILLDIVMPGLDGYAVCQSLKRNVDLREIPVLMLTGKQIGPESRIRAIEVEAEGFLAKPFDESEWIAHIRAFAKLRQARRTSRQALEQWAEKEAARTRELEQELATRVRTEAELRESQKRIQSLFRVFPAGIGLVRDRVLLDVNRYICEMTGYSAEEMIGRNTRFLYPDQDHYEFATRREDWNRKAVETRWKTKDGRILDILLHSTYLDPADPTLGRTFMVMNITAQKQAQKKQDEQMAELQRWYSAMLGREGRVLELKKEVNELLLQRGETPRYQLP
jgi:PAS domain S-box-containing protein